MASLASSHTGPSSFLHSLGDVLRPGAKNPTVALGRDAACSRVSGPWGLASLLESVPRYSLLPFFTLHAPRKPSVPGCLDIELLLLSVDVLSVFKVVPCPLLSLWHSLLHYLAQAVIIK